jgi:hypothetical protein
MAVTTTRARAGGARAGASRAGGFLSFYAGDPAGIFPTWTIEMAFGTPPMTRGAVWTDVTAYVRALSIRRGRSHELEHTQAGELTLRLANRDRRFDPSNTAGAYYPNVRPMTQVRVTAHYAGYDYPQYWGFVEDWGQVPVGRAIGAGGDVEVELRAVDAFKLLGLFTLTPYSEVILGDAPLLYCRMQEASLPILDEGSAASVPIKNGTNVYPGQGQAPLIGAAPSMRFDGTGWLMDSAPPAELICTDDVAVEAWIRPDIGASHVPGMSGTSPMAIARHGPAANFDWQLAYQPPIASFGASTSSADFVGDGFVTAGWSITAGHWAHLVGVRSGRDLLIYINGALASTARFQATVLRPVGPTFLSIGALFDGTWPFAGDVAHLAVYDHALDAQRIAAHYAAGFDTFAAQSSGAHIGGVLDAIGWPAGDARELDAGASTIGAYTPTGSALDWLLQVAETTEMGLLGVDNDGVLRFHDRHQILLDHLTSAATFGDDPAGSEKSYTDLQVRNDDRDLWTTVQVTRAGGATSTATDAAAEAAYGPRTLTLDGVLAGSDVDTQGQANYLLSRYKDPHPRVEQLMLWPARDQFLNPAVLALDCHHDRITIHRRPPGGGPLFSQDAHIEGLQLDLELPNKMTIAYDLIPAAATVPWILGDPVYGVLGSTTVVGF